PTSTLTLSLHDALPIAATIMALQAGKHVYVEKPGSHNPAEARLVVQAQQRYGKVVQMGNQQRSSPESQQAMQDIRDGLIGDVYYAKCFYANKRGPIGNGSIRSEEHTSELSHVASSYHVFCLKKK